MKQANKLGLLFSVVAIISVFMPWAEASSSYSAGSFGSGSYSTGGFSGISLGYGIAGLFLAVISAYMSFKSISHTWKIALIMLVDSISYFISMLFTGGTTTSSFGEFSASSSVSVDPKIGLFIFAISSALILITSLKNGKSIE